MLRIQRSDYPCMQQTETSSLRNAHSTADRSRTCIWFYLLRGVRCSVSSLPEFHPRTRGAGGSAPTPRAVLSRALPLPQAHLDAPPLSRSAHVTTPQKWVKVRAAAAPRRPTTARLGGGGGAADTAPPRATSTAPGFSARAVKVLPTPNKSSQREGLQAMKAAKYLKARRKKGCT